LKINVQFRSLIMCYLLP